MGIDSIASSISGHIATEAQYALLASVNQNAETVLKLFTAPTATGVDTYA